MASPSGTAVAVLHYLAPIITAVYFCAAKIIAGTYLQVPSKRAGSKYRRYPAIALQVAVVCTVLAEGITCIAQAIREVGWAASKDYIVYLSAILAVHTSLAVGLGENPKPLWHPYFGSWLCALLFDIPIIAVQGLRIPNNAYSEARMVCCALRALFLLVLVIVTSWFMLSDRPRSIRLEGDESEGLLAADRNNSKPSSPRDSLFPTEDSETNSGEASNPETDANNGTANDDSNADADNDGEEPDKDKELKAQQQARLQKSGSWIAYLKEFKIFIPLLFPARDRYIQFCCVVIGLTVVAGRVLNILVPAQLGKIVDGLAESSSTGVMPWKPLLLWMLFSALNSRAGLPLLKGAAELPVHQFGYKALTTTAFRHIMSLSMDFHTEKQSGELIRAISQGNSLQSMLDYLFFEVAPMIVDLVLAFIYVAYLFDIYMSMILFGVGVTYVWLGAKVTAWSIKTRRKYNNANREESQIQNEAIHNWQTVSHFNRAQYESDRYIAKIDAFNVAWRKYWAVYYMGGSLQSFLMLGGKMAACLLAAYRVSQGAAPVGNFITLVTYWTAIQTPLGSLSFSVRRISSMLTDSERLLQLLTTKSSINDAPDAEDIDIKHGEVAFDHVSFSYDPRKPTLKDVNFTVKPGQTVALVGETGGGKSTILKLLYRYYDVKDGAIRIDGQDLREVKLDSLRDSFGMVPQDPSLFNVSVMENIRYARLDATDAEVHEACKAAAIHEKIESFPDGYKAKVGERGVKLSGGELQRVAIARAILRQPKIVLLDEATSMIDAETEATIQSAFEKLTAKRTTFIVAHRLSTIQHADLILVINDGQIVERGTHDELFRQGGKYVALWSKQLSKEVKDIGKQLDVSPEDTPLVDLQDDEQ